MLINTSKTASRQGSSIAAGHEHLYGMRHCDTMNWNEYFDYCPTTGVFKWKTHRPDHHFVDDVRKRRWHTRYAGKQTGTICSNGYMQTEVMGRKVRLHRIAWEIMNGPIPNGMQIDHINGNRSDNRYHNLRLATILQNSWNSRVPSSNTSGYKGVYWHKQKGKWHAQIKHLGRSISLGLHDNASDAHDAYCIASSLLRGEYSRTK